jgi:hypothetical protein
LILSVPDEGYYVPDEGYYVPDEGYSKNALNLILKFWGQYNQRGGGLNRIAKII